MQHVIKSISLVAGGIVAGFALAHFANRTERGREVFAQINSFVDDFTDAVAQGYEARTEAIYAAIATNETD